MGVDDVELVGVVEDLAHRREEVRERLAGVPDRAQRLGDGGDVSAGDLRVAAGEGRDLVAAAIELDDELVDDPLGAAVGAGRHPLEGRCDLGDAERAVHGAIPRQMIAGQAAIAHRGPPTVWSKGHASITRARRARVSRIAATSRRPDGDIERTALTTTSGDRRAITRTARTALRRTREDIPRLGRIRVGAAGAVAIGIALGLAAIAAKGALNVLLGGDTGVPVLIAAVAVAAWIGGMRGGLTATLVAGVLNTIVFVGPDGPAFTLTGIDVARMVLYMLVGVIVSFLIASVRTSRDHLAASLAEVGAMAADIERRDERLELVLAASGTGFWEWDITTGRLVWSEAIFRQHGLDPADGAPTFEAYLATIHPDDRDRFRQSIDAALERGTSFSSEFRLLWADGSVHWTHGVGRVFRDAKGTPVRMVGTGTDITEQRRLEDQRDHLLDEERRAGTFREAFLDVISHELRTPITTILGLTQILSRPDRTIPSDRQAALIDDIAAESERLHRLVEDLLVLTRAERGEFAIEAEPLEIRRLLARVAERESKRLPGLSITTEVPRDLPIVAGEEVYVDQIVRNILSNAAKYTPVGTSVVIRAEQVGETVAIRVLDAGPGIDQASADRAFELFYRDPDRARTVAGSGHRPLRLREPGPRHGRDDLGPSAARGRLGVRVRAPGAPRRRVVLEPARYRARGGGRAGRLTQGPGAVACVRLGRPQLRGCATRGRCHRPPTLHVPSRPTRVRRDPAPRGHARPVRQAGSPRLL